MLNLFFLVWPAKNLLGLKLRLMFLIISKLIFYFPVLLVNRLQSRLNMKNFLIFVIIMVGLGILLVFVGICNQFLLFHLGPFQYGRDLWVDPWDIRKVNRSVFFGSFSDHHSSIASTPRLH